MKILLESRGEEMAMDAKLTLLWRCNYDNEKALSHLNSAPPHAKWASQHGRLLDYWSESEVSKFEKAFYLYGKTFRKLSQEVVTRSTEECVSFYYRWKKTARGSRGKRKYKNIPDLLELKSIFIPAPDVF